MFGNVTMHLGNTAKYNTLALTALRCLQDLRDSFPGQKIPDYQVLLVSDYFERPTRNLLQSAYASSFESSSVSGIVPSSEDVSMDHEPTSTSDVGYSIPMFDDALGVPEFSLVDPFSWGVDSDPILALQGPDG
jgi:hypothetical protein